MTTSYPAPMPSPAAVDRFIALIREGGGQVLLHQGQASYSIPCPPDEAGQSRPDAIEEAEALRFEHRIRGQHIAHRLAVEEAPETPTLDAVTDYIAALRVAGCEPVLSGGEVWLRSARPLDVFAVAEANLQAERDGVTFAHVADVLRIDEEAA